MSSEALVPGPETPFDKQLLDQYVLLMEMLENEAQLPATFKSQLPLTTAKVAFLTLQLKLVLLS